MYASKARLGFVVLDSDLNFEPEARRMLPEGAEFYVARVPYPHLMTPENLSAVEERLESVVAMLLPIRPNAITWCCTSGSFVNGVEGNRRILDRMRKVSRDIPVSTASQAIVGALQELGVKKLSVGSPYTEDINERLKLFLHEHGIQVIDIQGMFDPHEPIDDFEFQSSDFGAVEKFVRSLDRPHADGILISCTGMPIISFVEKLERDLKKPIVSSNMAIMWDALHLAGVKPDTKGFGRLLARR